MKNKKNDPETSKMDQAWIEELQNIIEHKIKEDTFSVDDLPVELLISRTQFYSKVKALTGFTPGVLIKNIRLDMAYKMIIDQPELKFSEISNILGMSDSKYFRKLFKKRFKKSPIEIRNKI